MRTTTKALTALIATAATLLAACGSSSDPLSSTASSVATSASSLVSSASSAATEATAATEETPASSEVSGDGGAVSIGSANFPESALLAEIYAGALTAKGVEVSKTLNIGNREAYFKGLLDGSIDLIPEYTGNLLAYVDSTATAVSAEDIYAALPTVLEPKGLTVLDQSAAEDKDAIVVTADTASKYNLKTIADLAAVAGQLTFGASPEFETRVDGLPGLKEKYGITFGTFLQLDAGGPLSANGLKNGQVDATDLFTTDPAIPANGYVVLEDPKNNFTAQIVVPLITKAAITPTITTTLNAVSAKLTTAGLTELLVRVYANESAETVAKDWLTQNGLI